MSAGLSAVGTKTYGESAEGFAAGISDPGKATLEKLYVDWGQPSQRRIIEAGPEDLDTYEFPAGSMGPKVRAACAFVRHSGAKAAIGALKDIEAIVAGAAGTLIINSVRGLREESV